MAIGIKWETVVQLSAIIMQSNMVRYNYMCPLYAVVWSHPSHYPVHPPTPPWSHQLTIMVMNDKLMSLSFHFNQPSDSWDEAISNFDLDKPRPRSWVRSKEKGTKLAQYSIDLLLFHFESIRPTIPDMELFQNLTFKNLRSNSWVRSKVKVTWLTQYLNDALLFCFASIGPTIPEIWSIECLTLEKHIQNFEKKNHRKKFPTEFSWNLIR